MSQYRLFWGDLHSHCGISYGKGSLEGALQRALTQLDFVSVTAHASWPDMPRDRSRYARIIDAHEQGFARAQQTWASVQETVEQCHRPGSFVPFLSYEWHSGQYGDHNVYFPGVSGEIVERDTLPELREAVAGWDALVIPHHIGYRQGFRGINWQTFTEERSPFAEIYSLHACAERDDAPYPMLHSMGPRHGGSTAACGLALGHKFGFVAGTDNHRGFPGSYPNGRQGVWATDLTRKALWEAFLERRTYAVTGDLIAIRFLINDAWMGSHIAGSDRQIHVDVTAVDAIEFVDLIKNNRRLRRWAPDDAPRPTGGQPCRAKFRVEWGWSELPDEYAWHGSLRLSDGRICSTQPCFGAETADVFPQQQQDHDDHTPPHQILEQTSDRLVWQSRTCRNPSFQQSALNGLVVEVEMPPNGTLQFDINGSHSTIVLENLWDRAEANYMAGFVSPAYRVSQAVPEASYRFTQTLDDQPETETDFYYLRVCQRNGQWAWASPVWVSA